MSPTFLRRIFWFLNRFFMVPLFRMGFGAVIGTPFGGYIMVIRTQGRKTGKLRYAPVNYAIFNGSIYCIAGFGKASGWFRNLQFNPDLELILPGGGLAGHMEITNDPAERILVARQILKNGGFAGYFFGFSPFTVSDERLAQAIADLPILCIKPTGIGSGAFDPGGLAWIPVLIVSILVIALLILHCSIFGQ
jgi:deazaflavin-dependent oxidoreductase (nitroreductase family)